MHLKDLTDMIFLVDMFAIDLGNGSSALVGSCGFVDKPSQTILCKQQSVERMCG